MKEQNKAARINRLVVIGVGLIGGSFAKAVRESLLVSEVVGYGRNPESLQRATDLGLVDNWTTELCEAVSEADIIMVATPVGVMPSVFAGLKDCLSPGAIVTDAGSVKKRVVEAADSFFCESSIRFVPGHPIAGREKSGAEAATGSLFYGHKVILTPTKDTDSDALDRIRTIWLATGASVMCMSPQQHDRLLALTSHLPHMIAFALVNLLADQGDDNSDPFRLAAGGFYDISRVASSDAVMWRDICLLNRDELAIRLDEYQGVIGELAALVESANAQGLEDFFIRAKDARSRIEKLNKDHS